MPTPMQHPGMPVAETQANATQSTRAARSSRQQALAARQSAQQGQRTRPTRPPRPPRPAAPISKAKLETRPHATPAAKPENIRSQTRRAGASQATASRSRTSQSAAGKALNRPAKAPADLHPLTDTTANERLYRYESSVKQAFDNIVPVLKQIASERCDPDFVDRAQQITAQEFGFELPAHILDTAWATGLDMRRLFAWCVFETYRRVSDEFFNADPLGGRVGNDFQAFLQQCGFHLMDITPCADGRLAHAISYVLRLPYGAVRRKSYAGSLFDIENTVEKWIETELMRFREGIPNRADEPTRYLKVVIYHFSSVDPAHQGCAAHGSDDEAAAREGWERLAALRQAIENGFCCGASVGLLLIGMDTDTDAIRVHVPDTNGYCELNQWLDVAKVHEITRGLSAAEARTRIAELVQAHMPGSHAGGAQANGMGASSTDGLSDKGMLQLIARLIENNLSQIDYVRHFHDGHYQDIGHAERFIGTGIGFEEIQLRNLTYFAYLSTVEEGAADLDVGIKIFTGLNVSRSLPVPIVVRYDYHGNVPGARERAVAHCERIAAALKARYPALCSDGMLHCLRAVRDCDAGTPIELVGSSLEPVTGGMH
jgi:carboxysome shell carbonic anhydrase